MFHADGRTFRRTDMTKLLVAFRNFTKMPNNKFQKVSAGCTHFVQVFVLLKITTALNSLYAFDVGTSAIYYLIPYVSKTFYILRLLRF